MVVVGEEASAGSVGAATVGVGLVAVEGSVAVVEVAVAGAAVDWVAVVAGEAAEMVDWGAGVEVVAAAQQRCVCTRCLGTAAPQRGCRSRATQAHPVVGTWAGHQKS